MPASLRPVRWGALVLVAMALVGSTESRGARPPSTDCPSVENRPLPPTLSGLRLALRVSPCHSLNRPGRAARPAEDPWLARDKATHVVVSGLWTLSTQYVLENEAGWSEGDALPVSVASAALVGGAKELYDTTTPTGTASARDLAANAVGIGLAVGVIVL